MTGKWLYEEDFEKRFCPQSFKNNIRGFFWPRLQKWAFSLSLVKQRIFEQNSNGDNNKVKSIYYWEIKTLSGDYMLWENVLTTAVSEMDQQRKQNNDWAEKKPELLCQSRINYCWSEKETFCALTAERTSPISKQTEFIWTSRGGASQRTILSVWL